MLKPIRIMKRILSFLALGSLSLLLAACYGSYALFHSLFVTVKSAASQEAIPDIHVSIKDSDGDILAEASTDEGGEAVLSYAPSASESALSFTVTATDVDGAENGSYVDQMQTVGPEDQDLFINLDEKQ